MIDLTLSSEQDLLRKTARDFAEKEIRPVADEIDRMDRAKEMPWDKVRPVYQKAARLGFTSLLIPEEYGGQGGTCIDNVLLQEELAAVDMGIAASYFNVTITGAVMISMGGTEEQKRAWLGEISRNDTAMLASAGSEADQAGSDSLCPYPDPKMGMRTFARRDGDGFVINGAKSAFITNAGAASHYFVMARTDLDGPPMMSTSVFYVPATTPGLSVGKLTELIGWKSVQNAEVYLDDVRVPASAELGGGGAGLGLFLFKALPFIGVGFAACHVGLARAAYEHALEYAQQRISWGVPIIKHQAVAGMLADMWVDLQAARLITWDAADAADRGDFSAMVKSPAAKTFAVDTAIRNAGRAVKTLGSYGITREYQAGKLLCDAWIGYPCDGTGQMLRLHMMNFLVPQPDGPPGMPGMEMGGMPPGMPPFGPDGPPGMPPFGPGGPGGPPVMPPFGPGSPGAMAPGMAPGMPGMPPSGMMPPADLGFPGAAPPAPALER